MSDVFKRSVLTVRFASVVCVLCARVSCPVTFFLLVGAIDCPPKPQERHFLVSKPPKGGEKAFLGISIIKNGGVFKQKATEMAQSFLS